MGRKDVCGGVGIEFEYFGCSISAGIQIDKKTLVIELGQGNRDFHGYRDGHGLQACTSHQNDFIPAIHRPDFACYPGCTFGIVFIDYHLGRFGGLGARGYMGFAEQMPKRKKQDAGKKNADGRIKIRCSQYAFSPIDEQNYKSGIHHP